MAPSGLITVTGGKWTTYRKMAADAVDNASFIAKLPKQKCISQNTPIGDEVEREKRINEIIKKEPSLNEAIHPNYAYTKADIVYAVQYEMAMCVEDILARRIRLLFLDAKIAIQVAPLVANIIAPYLQKDKIWEATEVANFTTLAAQYII